MVILGIPDRFDPRLISRGNLKLWLDASRITGLNDGDAVTTWSDSSGNGYNATQATPANKPTYKTIILNSKPVVRFDGSDALSCGDVLDSVFAGASAKYTVFFVAQSTVASAQTVLGKFDAGANERGAIFGFRDNAGALHLDVASVNRIGSNYLVQRGNTDVLNTYTVASMIFDATEATNTNRQKIYRNGSAETLTAVLSGTGIAEDNAAALTLGATAGGTAYLTGDIAEVLVYLGMLNDAQRRRVENYLGKKYGIAITW